MSTAIAVIGAGVIGSTHILSLDKAEGAHLAAIVDPSDHAAQVAARHRVPHFRDLAALLASGAAEGAVIATPNETHVPLACQLLEAGLPAFVEKPVANTVEEGAALQTLSDQTGRPVLVGHHRRYNPMIRAVRTAIDDGRFGTLVTAHVSAVMAKPASYFATPFRIAPETGGPLTLNLIHEIGFVGFDYGLSEREIAKRIVVGHKVIWERTIEIE